MVIIREGLSSDNPRVIIIGGHSGGNPKRGAFM